ncbi:MAG: hypothetical protein ACMUIL_09580 [bacterium]
MRSVLRRISVVFSAGALGGLANGIAVWLFGVLSITRLLGVGIAPALTAPMIYHRVTWGGIWGMLFLIPIVKERYLIRGILWSLGPTVVQLFVVFPLKVQKGMLGLDLGTLTPVFVILFNAIWGIVAAYWLKYAGEPCSVIPFDGGPKNLLDRAARISDSNQPDQEEISQIVHKIRKT